MKVTHEIPYKHDGDMQKASDLVLVALGHGPDFKLRADTPNDTVHGAVTITHFDDRLVVEVEVYEQDEAPIPGETVFDKPLRASTFKRPARMPTHDEVCSCIEKVGKEP